MKSTGDLVRQHWFLILLLGAVALGLTVPDPGLWLAQKIGSKPFIFVLLFLTSLSFKSGELIAGFKSTKAMVLSLAGTYLILPLLFYVAAHFALGPQTPLGIGLMVLGAVPTTLASAAIWTRIAGGNAALAVALTVISNPINILLCPFILWCCFHQSFSIDPQMVMWDMVRYMLLPIGVGQLARRLLSRSQSRWEKPISVVSRLVLLWVIVQAASKAADTARLGLDHADPQAARLTIGTIVVLILACIACHLIAAACMELLGRALKIELKDRLAVVFIGSQKTLPVGLLIMDSYFSKFALGVLALVTYHALQLILDTFIAEFAQKRFPQEEDSQAAPGEGIGPAEKDCNP